MIVALRTDSPALDPLFFEDMSTAGRTWNPCVFRSRDFYLRFFTSVEPRHADEFFLLILTSAGKNYSVSSLFSRKKGILESSFSADGEIECLKAVSCSCVEQSDTVECRDEN